MKLAKALAISAQALKQDAVRAVERQPSTEAGERPTMVAGQEDGKTPLTARSAGKRSKASLRHVSRCVDVGFGAGDEGLPMLAARLQTRAQDNVHVLVATRSMLVRTIDLLK